jgi:hypothetical protein
MAIKYLNAITINGSGGTVLDVQGSQGQLFSVTDSLTGDIFAVSDISGVPIFTVNSSGVSYFDGNVGIGTTSPGAKLDVNGDVFINSNYTANVAAQDLTIGKTTTGDHGLTIVTGPTYTGSIYFGDSGNNDAGIIKYQHSNNSMQFVTNRSEKMRIDSSGNVGILTTNPLDRLQVSGVISATANDTAYGQGYFAKLSSDYGTNALRLTSKTGDVFQATNFGRDIALLTGAPTSEKMRITSAGNVGIGTDSPTSKLQVSGSGNESVEIKVSGGTTAGNTGSISLSRTDGGGSIIQGAAFLSGGVPIGGIAGGVVGSSNTSAPAFAIQTPNSTNGHIVFNPRGTEKVRITSAGNVGVGTTSPSATLVVSNGGAAGIELQPEQTTDTNRILNYDRVTATYMDLRIDANAHQFMISGTERMRINTAGNVGIGTTSPFTIGGTAKLSLYASGPSTFGLSSSDAVYLRRYGVGQYQFQTTANGGNNGDLSLQSYGGNVGIGTTSPQTKLQVVYTDTHTSGDLTLSNSAFDIYNDYTTDVAGKGSTLTFSDNYLGINKTTRAAIKGGTEDAGNTANGFLAFYTDSGGANSMQERIYINEVGAIKFNNYDSTNRTGTPTYLLGTDGSGNIVKTNTVPGSAAGPYLPLVGGTMTGTNGVLMPDNFKLKFGDATTPDLEIYHDGSNSRIVDNGTGELRLQGTNLRLWASNGENYLTAVQGGAVSLYFNASKKFETTSSGVTVTGAAIIENTSAVTNDSVNVLDIKSLSSGTTANGFGVGLGFFAENSTYSTVNEIGRIEVVETSEVNLNDKMIFYVKDNNTLAERLSITGSGATFAGEGSFGGIIDMNSNKITELAPGSNNLDAVNYQQLQDAIAGVLVYQGTWNASTNTPTLASGVGTPGYYYIVSVAGSTNLDGITDWLPGDWAIFSDLATDVWQKIDHTNVLNGAGTGNKVTKWSGSGTSYTLTDSSIADTGSAVTITNPTTVTGILTANIGIEMISGNFNAGDGERIRLGNSADFQIYHDGSNSYIDEVGTGSLIIKSSTIIEMKGANNEYLARFIENGSVDLYYNNSLKFETTGSGVLVLGDVQIDSALLSNQENTDVDTGTETVANVAIATYTAAFFDFVIKKTTNVRSGTVYACHDGTNVVYTETSTNDLGDTSDVTLSVDISGGNMRLLATVTSDDWSVKSLIRAI